MPYLIMKKIVREHVELKEAQGGRTYGQLLDAAIGNALDEHQELAEIQFGFEGDEWLHFANTADSDDYRSASSVHPDGFGKGVSLRKQRKPAADWPVEV